MQRVLESGEAGPVLPGTTHDNARLRFARTTIHARLIAIVLAMAVPLNVVVIVVIWRLASAANETQRASLLYSARSIAAAVDAELGKYITLAQVLSRSPALLEENLDVFESELRRALGPVPDAWALVAEPNGHQLLNTVMPQGQPRLSSKRNNEGLAAQTKAFETRSVFVSDVSLGPDRRWVATANVPVFKNDQPFRAFALAMHVRHFLDLVASQDMPKNWLAAIRDAQGRLVVRVPDLERRIGQLANERVREIKDKDGLFELAMHKGDQFIVANARSQLSGWTVGVAAKTAELRAAVISTVGWAIALGGTISVLSFMFALWIARRMTRPLAELRQKAAALLTDPQVPFDPGVPELSDLWATLKKAAANRLRDDTMLRNSEKRLSQIINTYNGYVGLLDKNGRITEANVQMLEAVGAPREAVIGKPFADIPWWRYSPQARNGMQELIARCLAGETARQDLRYAACGLEIRWIDFQATPLRTANGAIYGVVPSGHDITDRKRAEGALHRSEARFRNLYEHAFAGITLSDLDGRLMQCNPAFCALVGYSEDELRGVHFGSLIHPEDRDDNIERDRRVRNGEVNAIEIESRYVHKNGQPVWARKIISMLPDETGKPSGIFALAVDISERKQQEELLRQSEARLQLALDADGAGTWESSPESGEFIASDRALTLYGLPPGSPMTRDKALAAVHSEDRPKVEQALGHTLETGAPFLVEIRCPQPDGSMRWLHSQGKLHEIQGRRRLIGLVRDISGRKAAEAAILTSQTHLQLALDAARLGWWLYNPVQQTASWDSRFKAIFDIVDPQTNVASIMARVPPEDVSRVCAAAAAALDPLDPKPFVGEYRIQRTDGEIRWIEVYGMATFEGTGEVRRAVVMVGTAADITERKGAEEHQFLLMRELNHRTKNLLSVVQSIANQTAASNPSDFAERFSQRIRALSANQDLLIRNEWRGVELEDLVRAQLSHFADLIGERIVIEGPHLNVTPSAAQSIGMALHELATNAGKYGSLSDDHGGVKIDWRLENGRFSIGWIEHDGPRVEPPKRRGFGSTMISVVAKASVGGEVELDYASTGVIWRLKCSASKALSARASGNSFSSDVTRSA
jgi:PAS domain S-box-containing protein